MPSIRKYLAFAVAMAVVFAPAPASSAEAAPVNHDLRLSLDPATRVVDAVDRIRLTGPIDAVLGLGEDFVVDELRVDGKRALHGLRHARLPVRFDDAAVHEIVVRYHGTLAPRETDGGPAGGRRAIADPSGSYLPAGAGWYPSLGEETMTYTLTVDVPDGQRAVAPGELVEERVADGRYRATFAFSQPAEDVTLMVGPYLVGERWRGGVLLRTYFHPEIAGEADAYLSKTAEYLDLYEDWIGPYPFTAFHVVSSPLPVGLGFAGLTYIGTRVLRLPFIRDTSLGHEVLHNWWGNGVYIDYETGNWAEGLTTFMADYAFAERRAPDEALQMRLKWLRDFAALPEDRDIVVRDFVWRRHDAAQVTGYNKVAMVFVMLRDEIGRDAFDAGIRLFWQQKRFRRASWDDLRAAFETAAGRDLGRFFEQWLERKGAPSIRLRDACVQRVDEGYEISFTLDQEAPVYGLTLTVEVVTESGPVRSRVSLDRRHRRFAVTVPGRPRALEVDPESLVFRRLAAEEVPTILRHATLDPATVAVVAADEPETEAAARTIGERLVEDGAIKPGTLLSRLPAPLLVVGSSDGVARLLARVGLAPAPGAVRGRGSARMWTARQPDGLPLVVVEGDDAPALAAMARALPHYGGASYLVFDGGKVVDRGVWPPPERPLRVELP